MARRVVTAREQQEMLSPWKTASPWHSNPGDPAYSIPTPELKRYQQFNPGVETPQEMHMTLWDRNWGRNGEEEPETRHYRTDNFSSGGDGSPGGGDEGSSEEDLVEGFESGAKFPPVEITTNGHGALLSDGNHRVNVADMMSHPALDSYIHYDPHQYDDDDLTDAVDPHSELGRHINKLVQNHPYKPIGDEAPTTRHVFRRHPETGKWQRGVRDGADPAQYVDTPDYLEQMKQQVPGFQDQGLGTYWDVDWGNGPEPTNSRFLHARRTAGTYYHLTDSPDFHPDPHHSPELNTTMGGDMKPGLFLTQQPEHWMQGYGYYRPYVSEIEADDDVGQGSRLSPERYVPAEQYDRLKVNRTIPIDAYTREKWGESGPVESSYGEDFETGEKFTDKAPGSLDLYKKTPGYKYPGTVADRPEEWRRSYEQKVRDYQQRTPGIIAGRG